LREQPGLSNSNPIRPHPPTDRGTIAAAGVIGAMVIAGVVTIVIYLILLVTISRQW
jgi:hypothetical protein